MIERHLPLTYTIVGGAPIVLTASWKLVASISQWTKGLRVAPIATATAYDIEWVSVPAGSSVPTDTYGEPVFGGEDFASGIPIGDLYLKSASNQTALVKIGA